MGWSYDSEKQSSDKGSLTRVERSFGRADDFPPLGGTGRSGLRNPIIRMWVNEGPLRKGRLLGLMTDLTYVNNLIARIEAKDLTIGALKAQIAFLERELAQYRKLEAAAYEAVTPEEKRVVLMGAQPC